MVNAVTIAPLNRSSTCPGEVVQAQTFGIADRGRRIAENGYAVKHHTAAAVFNDDDVLGNDSTYE